jgi:hypothetical protein
MNSFLLLFKDMKRAAQKSIGFIIPLTVLIASLAVSVFGQAKSEPQIAKIQKTRVVARGRLSGTKAIQQIITWQTANPSGGYLPYAKAYLAIDAVDANSYTLFQADGGDSQYLVDAIQLADLDGDGIPEILSLWWEGASAGAVLRVFHFDKTLRGFTELKSEEDLGGVHRYRVISAGKAKRQVMIYTRGDVSSRTPTASSYELRNSKIVAVKKREGKTGMDKENQGEAGIEGQSFIGPIRPHIRQNDTTPNVAPYKATLVILTANGEREVTRFETEADGRFRVVLSPGEYIVRSVGGQGKMAPRANEENVTVRAGQFTKVQINFDSGMR